jgi:hypothetical protein
VYSEFCPLEDLERDGDEDDVDWDAEADPYCFDVNIFLWRIMVGRLTPPEDIIVNTFRRVDGPYEIAVEWFACKPPRKSHGEHQAEDNCTKGPDEVSKTSEMCRY